MIAVLKKELRSYMRTMTGYVFIAFVLVVIGIYFSFINLNLCSPRFELALNNVQFVFIVFVPLLTMRVIAEERAGKTDQLLLTLPLTVPEIVFGKYLALVALYSIPMLIICFYPLIMGSAGQINYAAAYLSIFGFFLLGCANIALGEFLSSLTENPVISAVLCFAVLLILYLMKSISGLIPNTAAASFYAFTALILAICGIIFNLLRSRLLTAIVFVIAEGFLAVLYFMSRTSLEGIFPKLLSQLYMNGRLTGFFDGILDLRATVYYLSISAAALFLTIQTITKRRWS